MINTLARFLARPAVADWLIRRAMKRPYSPIVKDGELYMERYWLFNPYPDTGQSGADRPWWHLPISIRIHCIRLPDQDAHRHDHPWNARTFILRGWYAEQRPVEIGAAIAKAFPKVAGNLKGTIDTTFYRFSGDTARLKFGEYHRITEVPIGGVWTLFVTGPHRGVWGFLVDGVKVPWRRYLGLDE